MSKQKLYFRFSDGHDTSGVIMELSGCVAWIEADIESGSDSPEDMIYTLEPVWLTDEEYNKLPEAEL